MKLSSFSVPRGDNLSSLQVRLGDSVQQVIEAITRESSRSTTSGFMTVVDSSGVVVGVITDSDIRKRVLDSQFLDLRAEDLMTSDFIFVQTDISEKDTVLSVQKQLEKRNSTGRIPVTYVPVIDADGRLIEVTHIASLMLNLQRELQQIVVLGLGYVGLTFAAVLASKGLDVIGIDKESDLVELLNSGRVPIHEPLLPEILCEFLGNNLRFRGVKEGLEGRSSILIRRYYVIAVGTPINQETGKVDLTYLEEAVAEVARHVQSGDVIVVRSTVPVGTTRHLVGSLLGSITGLELGTELHLIFAPERTVEGHAIEELQNLPQLICGISEKSTQIGISFFSQFCSRIVRTESLEACEFAKLMSNAYRDTMFNFANEMAFLSRRYGIEVTGLIEDANSGYPRNNIPMPSPGVGGPCLSKDSKLLIGEHAHHPSVILSSRNFNDFFERHLLAEINSRIDDSDVIALIGMAFKGVPQTSDTRHSFGTICYEMLSVRGISVLVLDANLNDSQLTLKGLKSRNLDERTPNVVIVCNNDPGNVVLVEKIVVEREQDMKLLVDPWRILKGKAIEKTFMSVVGLSGEVKL